MIVRPRAGVETLAPPAAILGALADAWRGAPRDRIADWWQSPVFTFSTPAQLWRAMLVRWQRPQPALKIVANPRELEWTEDIDFQ